MVINKRFDRATNLLKVTRALHSMFYEQAKFDQHKGSRCDRLNAIVEYVITVSLKSLNLRYVTSVFILKSCTNKTTKLFQFFYGRYYRRMSVHENRPVL